MTGATPTSRSLRLLRANGYAAEVVEKWIRVPTLPGGGIRRDLFDVIDVVGIKVGVDGVVGVQATSASNMGSRVKKCLESDNARIWLEAKNHLWVIGWRKNAANRWVNKIREIKLADFEPKPKGRAKKCQK